MLLLHYFTLMNGDRSVLYYDLEEMINESQNL
jgi:hypothetical protein